MTSPRDEIDEWLGGEVRPLYPPQGSLDQIRHRARRRKTQQAVFAAAGCAVVLAAAIAVPQLVGGGRQARGPIPPVAAGSTPSSSQASVSQGSTRGTGPAATSSSKMTQHSYLSTTTSGDPVPPHFRPTSVTFVGAGASIVGAVIGQAGPPCKTSNCTSLAGTSDYGSSWYGVSAPLAPGADASTGVSQLRFANIRDGWAFGPALYETSRGGWPWNPEDTFGQRVIDVEAAHGRALAIFGTCTGTGSAYASNCTSFAVYASAAGTRTWTPVTVPPGSMSAGQASSASLVVAGNAGYVLTPTGEVLTGSVSGGTLQLAGKARCSPGPAQASGLPSLAQLAASPTQLLLACATGTAGTTSVYTSTTGSSWQPAGTVTHGGSATSLASGVAGQVVLATTTGIYQSTDGGKTWRQASLTGTGPPGGFTYIGMTNASDGVAVPAEASLGLIYVTADGGATWQQRAISG